MRNNVAILDIGSHKLVFAVAQKTSNGIYIIKNLATFLYSGYYKGQWLEPNQLKSNILSVVKQSGYDAKLGGVYVSLPSDFSKVQYNSFVANFGKERIITNKILNQIHNASAIYSSDSRYQVISSACTSYEIDDNLPTISALGESATFIKANMSYVLGDKSFVSTIENIMHSIGFSNCKFVSTAWAQGSMLLDKSTKQQGAIICDIGYVNTSISYHLGEGIAYLASESIGGANIVDDLSYALEIDFDQASQLLSKINLSIDTNNDNTMIEVQKDEELLEYNANELNQIVQARIDDFVDLITEHCKVVDKPFVSIPLYITGGGITNIKGAILYMQNKLEHNIRILTADVPQLDKPYDSSLIALIDVASEINQNKSFWEKIFR